ncbi:keratin, type I cytoskeletal 9 isoform X2 [Octopus sinensis]|uniref:Keratin, type I cytoskeletal 9 isoform X2 n=1 Tax=Octopus sinensis TaxID=2607531 RepID=A0A6P7T6D8_9MOLL|nr:keratin, type I cytoskeletal 9 isoform X2 [Octopus sinensis]
MDRLAVQYKLRGALLKTNDNNNTQPPQSKMNDSEAESQQRTVGENTDTSKPGSDGLLRRVSGGSQSIRENLEPELEHKARKVSERFSENLHIITNEPSLAFFRIQEHVRKSLPQLVEQKHEVQEIHQNVQGACFDAEYAKNAVNAMQNSNVHFQNIQDLLKNAMFMKQQIEYEESRKQQERRHPSMYSTSGGAGSSSDIAVSALVSSNSGSSGGGVGGGVGGGGGGSGGSRNSGGGSGGVSRMNSSCCTDSSDSSMSQSGSGQPGTTNNTNRQEKKMTRSRSHSKPDNSRKSSASASVKSKRATSELAKKPL